MSLDFRFTVWAILFPATGIQNLGDATAASAHSLMA